MLKIVPPNSEKNLVHLSGYLSEQIDETHFVLKHKDSDVRKEFKLELVEEEGKVEFKGMPEMMKKYCRGFDNNEIKQYPNTILNVIIKQAYKPKKIFKSD